MFRHKKILSEEESGGHGDKWGVFSEDTEQFLSYALPHVLENSQKLDPPIQSLQENDVDGVLLRYEEGKDCGAVAVIATSEEENLLVSLYPECKGAVYETYIDGIELFPNRYEARLKVVVPGIEKEITLFDTRFLYLGPVYEEGTLYRTEIAALAYRIQRVDSDPIIIDNPEEIERYNATTYWVEKYGYYEKSDEENAIKLYRSESEMSMEPIVIHTDKMSMWLEDYLYKDEVHFRGRIEEIVPQEFHLLGARFGCYRIAIDLSGEREMVLPFYVLRDDMAEKSMGFDVGEYVEGVAWVHGFIKQ